MTGQYEKGKRSSFRDYCIENNRQDLLDQWHPTRNGELTPDQLSSGNGKKVWWICEKKHEWQATAYDRSRKNYRCPVCVGKKVVAGENDLEHLKPAVAKEWADKENGSLKPNQVSQNSQHRVWWKCEKGHKWRSSIYERAVCGHNCPYCARKIAATGENDLTISHPDLVKEWHPTKNGTNRPDQYLWGSHKKAWWVCDKGHEWNAQIKSRAGGAGCPYCTNRILLRGFNDLATLHPKIAAQWHPTKNGSLKPEDVVAGHHKKVWWLCEKGHEWEVGICVRTANGTNCPACAGKMVIPGENDFASAEPDLAAQWHPTKNGNLSPDQVTPQSNKKVWWICELGHEYDAVVSARTARGCGCPYCAGKRILPGFNDIATLFPAVSRQWHAELNGNLTPEMVGRGSNKKVWWLCDEGHIWKAVVYSRVGGDKCGCPVCAGTVNKKRLAKYKFMLAEAEAILRKRKEEEEEGIPL